MATSITYSWERICTDSTPPQARSSHEISFVGGSCYLWGGEHVARTPIDSELYILDLSSDRNGGEGWKKVELAADSGPPPSPRIAHGQAVLGSRIFVFGGREGITMDERPLNDLHYFDCETKRWSGPVQCTGETIPAARSFHKMTAANGILYVFGGCGVSGRLADLYSFDANSNTWTALPSCDRIAGRGGPGFDAVQDGNALIVATGFSGQENNDVHLFDLQLKVWRTIEPGQGIQDPEAFRPRSVCPFFTHDQGRFMILFGGEVDTSQRGHEGAGAFASDIVCIDCGTETATERGRPAVVRAVNGGGADTPCARGWTAMAGFPSDYGSGCAILFGGLTGDDENPERLNDTWKLTVSVVEA